jgi:hypothetical protein
MTNVPETFIRQSRLRYQIACRLITYLSYGCQYGSPFFYEVLLIIMKRQKDHRRRKYVVLVLILISTLG